MANLVDIITTIRNAVFGKDIRESIASGIESINSEVEGTTSKQNDLNDTFKQLIINAGNSNAEIVAARNEYDTLDDRLNDQKVNLISNTTDVQALKSLINNAVNGSPIPATLASQMTDHTRNYVYLGVEPGYVSNNLYYWNGAAFVDSGKQYQSSGIATEGVTHSNLKKKSITGDVLGSEGTIRDVLDYSKCKMLLPSGYIVAPNAVLTPGEIQIEVKIGTATSGYIYLLEKNVNNSVLVKASLPYNFASGINTINTGFTSDGNGKEYVGFYVANLYANSADVSTGYYWAITTTVPTNTSYTANAVSTSHVNPAVKIKTLAVISTTHIKDNQITLPKLGTDVINRFNNVENGLLYTNDTPITVDLSTVTTQTQVTTTSHPATIGRLWGILNIPITVQGTLIITIKVVAAISEYLVLLKKTGSTTYDIVDKQLVSLTSGISTITTKLKIVDDGEYYVAVTDRLINSSNGTLGNFYFKGNSTGDYLLEIFDFDINNKTSINASGSEGILLTNFLLGIEVTIIETLKESIDLIKSANKNDIPADIIYTEKFQDVPVPPYGQWIENGTKGTFSNGYTPVADATFANYLYLSQVTNFDTDTTKWLIQLKDVTSKFRLVRVSNISIKTTTCEFDNGIIRLYGVTERFAFNTASSVLISKALTMTLVQDREYLFTLENFGFVIRFAVTDTVTGDSEYISWDCTNQASAGLCMDYPLISLASGSITIKQFDYFTKYSRSPKVVIIGDSVVEGITIKDDGGWQARWAYKVYQALNGDAAILAVGGESTVSFIPKLPVLKRKFYHPSFVLLELMSNDLDFDAWKQNTESLISWAESLGAVPVFCMMPKTKMSLDFYNSVLAYVTASKYKIINFYKAMTIGGDGITNISSLFLDDQIHPNQDGHARMYKQVQADLAEIFPLDY